MAFQLVSVPQIYKYLMCQKYKKAEKIQSMGFARKFIYLYLWINCDKCVLTNHKIQLKNSAHEKKWIFYFCDLLSYFVFYNFLSENKGYVWQKEINHNRMDIQ